MHYLIVNGDLVASHLLTDRRIKQKTFQTALKLTALKFEDQFVSPLTNTSGDNFQMVLPDAHSLFAIISHLEFNVPSLAFRYGMGIGPIETEINPVAATGMDGDGFRNAHRAHEQARVRKSRYCFMSSTKEDIAIDLLLDWMGSEQQGWSAQKRRAFALYKRGLKQSIIAKRLHISQPAVSRMMRSTGQKLVLKTEVLVQEKMNDLMGFRGTNI